MCFVWALTLNTKNSTLQTYPVPARYFIEKIFHSKDIFFCKISLKFSRSHNHLIKGTKRHTCEVLSPCSPLPIVSSPMNKILTWSSAPSSWFPLACLTSSPVCLCLILTGFSRLMLLSNPWRISLMLPLISGWVPWRAGSIMQTSLPSSTQSDFVPFHYLIHCSPKLIFPLVVTFLKTGNLERKKNHFTVNKKYWNSCTIFQCLLCICTTLLLCQVNSSPPSGHGRAEQSLTFHGSSLW